MRRIIAAINMTLDGFCDHTAVDPDDEIHYHYADLLDNTDVILYGRVTYQLMQFWQSLLQTPSGDKSMDDFAIAIDRIEKIVFSNTLQATGWNTAHLADQSPGEVIQHLKQQPGGDILIGSRSLIIQLMKLDLLDELQLCVHPVVAGGGLPLFHDMHQRAALSLSKTKTFAGGAVLLYYKPSTDIARP